MNRVNFALVLHNHQPVGNFDEIYKLACTQAYEPFLDIIDRMPGIRLTLHISGCLMEWFEEHRQDMVDRIAALVGRGQVELMGGGFYEPILSMLHENDRIGQIQMFSEYIEKRFGQKVRGMWVPERVWEQSLTSSIADAGPEYTVLDDSHFRNVGLKPETLSGCYITEDQGRILRLYPASEQLRYFIPYAHPHETISYLGSFASEQGNNVIVYGDDGEKFGMWPRTFDHVYTNGWLQSFFETLLENSDWINLVTLSEATDRCPPVGRVYLSDASYREMTEWALPADRLMEYEDVAEHLKHVGAYDRASSFLRGGSWRNFKVKYPEANKMYARLCQVSNRVAMLKKSEPETYEKARRELYRGQCNCPYWHGVFGGLYLSHLRSAVFEHFCAAEQLAENALQKQSEWLDIREEDFDFDGEPEVLLASSSLRAFLTPGHGGHIYELDIAAKGLNVVNTLSRHREAYHRKVADAKVISPNDEVRSIHDAVLAKEPDLKDRLHYDWYLRESLIDHFLGDGVTLNQFERAEYSEVGDFVLGSYTHKHKRSAKEAKAILRREGTVWIEQQPLPVSIEKEVAIARDRPLLRSKYTVTNNSTQTLNTRFGIEFAVALRSGISDACWYYSSDPDAKLGGLLDMNEWPGLGEFGVADRDYGLNIHYIWDQPATVWVLPIQTVSQSEGGFELSYQGSAAMPIWQLNIEPGSSWTIAIENTIKLL